MGSAGAPAAHEADSVHAQANAFAAKLIRARGEPHEVADKLETLVADDLCPMPQYRELLFVY